MKLRKYFELQRNIECSQAQKMIILEKITNKIQKRSFFSYVTFYKKVGIYFSIIVFLLLSFYSSYFFEQKPDYQISKIGSGIVTQQKIKDDKIIAKAQSIGKIIETVGEIKITKNGVETPGNILSDGDSILLLAGAEMKFVVSSGTQAFIKGPAQFTLQYVGEENGRKNYVVNLIHGDYFEILSENTELNNLIVKTNEFEIESQKVTDSMNIKITGQGDKRILENKGGDIVVKKVVDNKKVYSSVKSKQKAQIDEEVKIIQEVKYISNQVKNKQISSTYDITGINESVDLSGSETTVDLKMPKTSEILEDSKVILEEEQLEEFKNLTYPAFLIKDIENLSIAYLKGNESSFQISYENYLQRIKKIYKLLDLQVDSKLFEINFAQENITVNDLIIITDQLYAKIDKGFYLPPKYLKRIKTLLGRLLVLKDEKYGSHRGESIEFTKLLDIIKKSDLSNQLIIE